MRRRIFFDLFFIFVFVTSFLIRLLIISDNNLAFTSDQARDMIAIRAIVHDLDIPLIGPITGIPGLYLGPFWFFFNVIPFVISGGSPTSLLIWQIVWLELSVAFLYWYFRNTKPTFALLSSSLLLLSPIFFYISRYSFNPHLLPAFLIFFFILLDSFAKKKKAFKSLLLGLVVGLSLQLEAATAIVLLPVVIFFLYKDKNHLLYFLFTFLLTLLPQLLFELRHNFLMTKVFLDQLTGKNDVIQNTLQFKPLIYDRLNSLKYLAAQTFPLLHYLTVLLFTIGTFIYSRKRKQDVFIKANLLFFIFFYLLFLVFPHPLKTWYLYALVLPIVFVISDLLEDFQRPAIIFLVVILAASLLQQKNQISAASSLDPSNLNNRLKTVEKVYELANGDGFNLYNYTPSVYDYPYQYLFWWQGREYGYHPAKITYQDNVPEYIPNNDRLLNLKKEATQTFFIVEENKTQEANLWLNQFELTDPLRLDLPWQTTIIRIKDDEN